MTRTTSINEQARIHRATSDDGTEIAGHVYGEGPPLVLVPGAMSAGDFVWEPLLPLLTKHFTCYPIGKRGHAPLGEPTTDLSPLRMVQDVVAFIESIGEPVGLIGWSGGGVLSLAAAQHTDAVSALAAYEPAVVEAMREDELGRFKSTFMRMGELAGEGRLREAARAFIELVANEDEVDHAKELGFFEGWAPNVPVFLQEQQQLLAYEGPRPMEPVQLVRLELPILLLQGSRSIPDPWFSESVRYVAEHVADPSVREIPAAGHLGPSHKPQAVADELVRFFADVHVSV